MGELTIRAGTQDYSGSQFDAYGSPHSAFAAEDIEDFVQKTKTLADYYSTIEVFDGTNVDGRNVVVEAAADLSGMQATMALSNKIDGFDFEQFCTKFCETWATVTDPITLKATVAADTHPLNDLRLNVNMQMEDAMYQALGVQEGDGMHLAPEKRIAIWGENAQWTKKGAASLRSRVTPIRQTEGTVPRHARPSLPFGVAPPFAPYAPSHPHGSRPSNRMPNACPLRQGNAFGNQRLRLAPERRTASQAPHAALGT